ncbi:MAG: hypothetical protein Q8R92_21090 [Deltaproteobacteria bacterium]|nr:hypothetical protein [Deltaproteobacteria bacterium]
MIAFWAPPPILDRYATYLKRHGIELRYRAQKDLDIQRGAAMRAGRQSWELIQRMTFVEFDGMYRCLAAFVEKTNGD